MIAELGAGKFIAAGGCLVCGVVVIAAIGGGAKYAFTAADTAKLRAAICAYAAPPDAVRRVPAARFGLSSQQIANAREIVNVAAKLGLPRRAAEIALATAIQESSLINLRTGTGSYGLFQQQPSQGWGTKQQVTDPSHAARSFYTQLVEIPGWEHMPLTQAAALVQHPRQDLRDAYAKHEPRAKALVALLWKGGSPRRAAVDTATSDDMRASIQAAAGLGVPRDELVASIARDLASQDPGERPDPDEIRKRADDIVTTVAGQLCEELKLRANNPADKTASDGNALIESPSERGAIAVRAALRMIGMPYSWGGGGPGGPSFGTGRGAGIKGFDCAASPSTRGARQASASALPPAPSGIRASTSTAPSSNRATWCSSRTTPEIRTRSTTWASTSARGRWSTRRAPAAMCRSRRCPEATTPGPYDRLSGNSLNMIDHSRLPFALAA